MNQTPRATWSLIASQPLTRATALALVIALLITACSADTTNSVEAIQTNDGAVSVKPPDVLAGETDESSGDVALATTVPIDPDEGDDVSTDSTGVDAQAETTEAVPATESEFMPIPPNEFVWFDGTPGSTDDFAGTPTVLNFWSSNCAACVAEMPDFEEVAQEMAGRVAFVGMNRDDTRDFALQLAQETGVTYPLAEDIDSKIFISFRAFAMPTTVFLNEANEVVFVWQGALTGEDLLILIDRHLQPGNV